MLSAHPNPHPFFVPPFTQAAPVHVQPARPRRRSSDFEHRFLSERYRGGQARLEYALLYLGEVWACESVDRRQSLSIGASAQSRIMLETAAVPGFFELARPTATGWELQLEESFDGFVLKGEQKLRISELEAAGLARREGRWLVLPMNGETRLRLSFGQVTLLLHLVSAPSLRLPLFAMGASTALLLAAFVASALLHSAFGLLTVVSTTRVDELLIDRLDSRARYAEALLTPEATVEPEEEPLETVVASDEGDSSAVESGVSDGVSVVGDPRGSGEEAPSSGHGRDRELASNAGLLAAQHEMSTLLAMGANMGGFDAMNDWGEFTMASSATAGPGYGLAMHGAGRPAGVGNGDFVLGRFGERGIRKGNCEQCDEVPRLGQHEAKGPELKLKRPVIDGTLDKRIIQKVVNQHKGELKACYERELQKKRELEGKLTMQWLIDSSGNVAMVVVQESELNDSALETCVANSIRHWRFPPVKGSMIKVSYPFDFSNGDG
ncbi:MAG: AgmX/PglI C-terminal domain-containing protein [Myxococcota bacterium]|jgi:hypothetical protein|nr:AgmX/PglI C-terminal domain-containing protein [Myxococcota bacterium]